MNIENVLVPCSAYSLAADWYKNEDSNKVLFALLGYGSSKARNSDFLRSIAEQTGMNVLAVDLSGHGDSTFKLDKTRPAQHLLEAIDIFDWIKKEHPNAEITIMGTSYGGFLAANITRYRNFNKLILRTPAIYLPSDLYSLQADIDRDYTSNVYRKNRQAVANHPLFKQASVFNGKALLVVHELDEDVPVQTSDVCKQSFSPDVYVAPGFKHSMRDASNPLEGMAAYQDTIAEWLLK